MVKVSIVIPAYNEEGRIKATLERCLKFLKSKKYSWELIVVDDGSKDKTAEIVKSFKKIKLISYKPNGGKGYAVKKGVLESKGDYVLFSDADLSAPIEELDKLMEFIDEYDIVIGSRGVRESEANMVASRKLIGRAFNFTIKILTGLYFKDTQCGFKLFKRKAAQELFKKQTIMGWVFDVEILFLAKKKGYRIKEVGVKWEHKEHDKVSPASDSFNIIKEVLKIWWNSLLRRYN